MPTAPTHALAALALGTAFYRPGTPKRLWAWGAGLAALPDLDVIGFGFGINYGDLLGHRGLSHSLAFATALAGAVVAIWFRGGAGPLPRTLVWTYLALATASHGLLDMLTDGGLGIAIGAPIDHTRYFFPVRPVAVAPIGLSGLLQPGMGRVIATELIWIWGPAVAFALIAFGLNRAHLRREPASPPTR